MKRICVFCGSSTGADPAYLGATRHFARLVAERGLGLVFGGGAMGLMGALATAYLEASGRDLVGVLPERFGLELAHAGLTEVRVTRTMHERKQTMYDLADAFAALPGGMGTLDELMETLTLAQLAEHDKPIGLLDVSGYYRRLRELLDEMRDERFCSEADRSRLLEDSSPESLLERLLSYRASTRSGSPPGKP